jgi:hypothetical protein
VERKETPIMPTIRNLSRSRMVLSHVHEEPIILEPGDSVDVPPEALSLPLIRHYIQVKRLDLVSQHAAPTEVILSRPKIG